MVKMDEGIEGPVCKGGATNWRWGVNVLEGGGVNTGKTLKFEKVGVHDPPLPSSYGGAASAGT